ncbi:hypothetical protein SNE23_28255 (plasmid) [Bacillus sp. RA(2023)]|nr:MULTISPECIES: hypothetical protein [Bacillus]WPU78012.1 hypothetical protein SNE23_28255 [Bacillus sp. RA(2023)]
MNGSIKKDKKTGRYFCIVDIGIFFLTGKKRKIRKEDSLLKEKQKIL